MFVLALKNWGGLLEVCSWVTRPMDIANMTVEITKYIEVRHLHYNIYSAIRQRVSISNLPKICKLVLLNSAI